MEQSPLIEKEGGDIQETTPKEVPKTKPVEQEQTPKVSDEKVVENGEDSRFLVKGKAKESVRNFKSALVDVWLLVTPYLMSCRILQPMAEDSVKVVEYAARKLDSFSAKYETVQDVKLLDIVELVRSFAFDGLEFLQSNEFERRIMKYFIHCHMMILETLDYADDVMEVVAPTVPGVQPLLELDAAERSIRKKSFYLIVNFFYRLTKKMVAYAEDLCDQLKKCISFSGFSCGKADAVVDVAVE